MRKILTILLLCLACRSFAQKIDNVLKARLDSIMADDQRYRELMVIQPGPQRDSIARVLHIASDNVNDYFSDRQNILDSINVLKVEAIIHAVGYPGRSMVGTPENETVYYVIQHSDKISKYFPIIEQAGKKGELSFTLVAMMQDRLLKSEGKEQIYGTQYAGFAVNDSISHQRKIVWILWPVKDYARVDDRRKKAGFKETIAQDAADQGIEPEVIDIAKARKKYPWLFPKK